MAGLGIAIQIVTGFWLTFYYVAAEGMAFGSVERIMRDVFFGNFIRYMHANGASVLFFIVYLHIARTFYYKLYAGAARQYFLWASGLLLFILIMAAAFTGYILPWGQMSFWGATVITNLFSVIPLFGTTITS